MQKTNDTKSKCNCCKECLKKCKNRTTDWLSKRTDFEMYPAQYYFFYEEYRVKDIISFTKNDKVLYNYLIDNNILGEKLCYLEIANKLLLKDDEYYLNKEENVDSILDYLYWSYGNPYDTDNLLRKHFVKEAMKEYKCNCKVEWEYSCINYAKALRYVEDMWDCMPALYIPYVNEYTKRRIISQQKNDEFLYKYILKNNLLEDDLCYYSLACKLLIEENSYLLIEHEGNLKFLIDYLVWSYGLPYDENNYLRKQIRFKNQKEIKEKYKTTIQKRRIGQAEYREDLIKYYGKCQICGIESRELLVASHIKDFSKSENNEATDLYNGFLFCNGHDGIFDKGLISFTDEGNVMVSSKLSKHDLDIIKPETIKMNILEEQKKYLKWHRENKFKK
ncbi:MAG: hypothetical protein LLF98_10365 [Clostridium sp.]|uniref:HNH endonuclease n=1 Tax=Clostridium sp. TaxID=1506 RepID=UPI0025BE2CB6|nr:HNH endonuclease [Clostridium sp.]MCE5221641.1 hypothetical protein [Clostridium sp.]